MEIRSVSLRKIINSRTKTTVEAEINDSYGKAPSGTSTGTHEAHSFTPENLEEIEEILTQLENQEFTQNEFDEKLEEIDGTDDFSSIGSVSIASSFAFKNASGFNHSEKFPLPLSNIVGGGEHGGNTSIQEFLVLPVNADSFPEAVETNVAIYQEMKEKYSRKLQGMNDEGALVFSMDDEETLKALKKIADKHGAKLGVDIAASELYEDGKYDIGSMRRRHSPEQHLKFVQQLIDVFDLFYVEDAFDEDDFRMHAKLASNNPEKLIVGDDIFASSDERLQEGIDNGSCNSIILKPDQAGTISRTRETLELARDNDYTPIISHRSGETSDSTISDLALEWECPIIKAGIADIRVSKLNKLLRIWDEMDEAKMNEI